MRGENENKGKSFLSSARVISRHILLFLFEIVYKKISKKYFFRIFQLVKSVSPFIWYNYCCRCMFKIIINGIQMRYLLKVGT